MRSGREGLVYTSVDYKPTKPTFCLTCGLNYAGWEILKEISIKCAHYLDGLGRKHVLGKPWRAESCVRSFNQMNRGYACIMLRTKNRIMIAKRIINKNLTSIYYFECIYKCERIKNGGLLKIWFPIMHDLDCTHCVPSSGSSALMEFCKRQSLRPGHQVSLLIFGTRQVKTLWFALRRWSL